MNVSAASGGALSNQSAPLDINDSIEVSSVNLGDLSMFANFVFVVSASVSSAPPPWFARPQVSCPAPRAPLALRSCSALGG